MCVLLHGWFGTHRQCTFTCSYTHRRTHARIYSALPNVNVYKCTTQLLALTHSLTHSRTHTLTHARTHARTHSLSHSRTHSLTHSLTHSFTHSLTLTGGLLHSDPDTTHSMRTITDQAWLPSPIPCLHRFHDTKPLKGAHRVQVRNPSPNP